MNIFANKIFLHRSLPLIFAVPSIKLSNLAILTSVITIFFSIIFYILVGYWASFPYFILTTALLSMHALVAVITTAGNVLYSVRYMLVWILIFVTAYLWTNVHGEVFVAPFGLAYQNADNTRSLVLAGILSLCGSLMGWHMSIKKFHRSISKFYILSKKRQNQLRLVGLILAFGFATIYIWKVGGFISNEKTYADGSQGFDLEFGVFNIFHFIGIALLLVSNVTVNAIRRKYLFIALFTLLAGIMTGSRADFLPQAIIIIVFLFNKRIVKIFESKKYLHLFGYSVGSVIFILIGYVIANIIAQWRYIGNDPSAVVSIFLETEHGLLINEIYGHRMLYLETGNMMLGGMYAAIENVRRGVDGLRLGESYFNYLLIAPPAFLGLPRPLGLEWDANVNGAVMAQGGIFEVAEAYWNFGFFGCFLVSFGLSYFFAWLLRRGLLRNNYFFLVWYIVFGLHGFRAIWYQTFGYFRLMTIMLVIYVFGYLWAKWFIAPRDHVQNSV